MLKLHGYFKDGAIIQRGKPINVKGFAEKEVECVLKGGEYRYDLKVNPCGGKFRTEFPAVFDTKSVFTLSVSDGTESVSVNVRFGDVYMTAGQSNMSYALSATEDCDKYLAKAGESDISLLCLEEPPFSDTSEIHRPAYPKEDFISDYAWKKGSECSDVSAIAVIAASFVSERKGIPVGIVQTAMGGLSAETYCSRKTAETDADLIAFLKRMGRYCTAEDYNHSGIRNFTQISGVYNEKIAPLEGISFAGIVWYLGESSSCDFEYAQYFYRTMLLIKRDFDAMFGRIPFVAVHIAPEYYPYGDRCGYMEINEAITRLEKDETVTAVPIYDIEPRWLKTDGELYYHPIHTVNKAPVAERVADVLSGKRKRYPRIEKVIIDGGKAVCITCGGKLKGDKLNGFTVAGKNGKYYPAAAFVRSENEIEVYSREVKEPIYITYAFMQYQDFCNAVTEDGAPLLPYRSVEEEINGNYCFIPAYTVRGAAMVYENCFGWNVGTCRKVPVWKKGEIYDAGDVEISVGEDGVKCRCVPQAEKYFFFGLSPAFCLSGHRNHVADYGYWTVELTADSDTEFMGVVVRSYDGEVFRPDLYNGAKKAESVLIGNTPTVLSVCWKSGIRGDSAPIKFGKNMRKKFVQAEFLFRAKSETTVTIHSVELSDKNRSKGGTAAERKSSRSDAVLPTTE